MSEHQFRGRREDLRLVTGRGRYTADHQFQRRRSPDIFSAPTARMRRSSRIDIEEAKKLPGVLDILTGADLVATGWKGAPAHGVFQGRRRLSLRVPFRQGLRIGRVRFVGEPVALVVAETDAIAQDAAELIAVEYEDLPVYRDRERRACRRAPSPLHDDVPDNLAFDYEYGDRASTEPGFTDAAHVVRVALHAQRISGNPMEPKSCTRALRRRGRCLRALHSDARASPTCEHAVRHDRACGGEIPHPFDRRRRRASACATRCIQSSSRSCWRRSAPASRSNGIGTRSETISGDHQARGADLIGELALDARGKFLALRVEWLVNLGAFCSNAGPLINTVAAPTSSAMSLYKFGALYGQHRLVFTNTTPTTAYRGAGRPNVAYLWERLVEEAALRDRGRSG